MKQWECRNHDGKDRTISHDEVSFQCRTCGARFHQGCLNMAANPNKKSNKCPVCCDRGNLERAQHGIGQVIKIGGTNHPLDSAFKNR